LDVYLKHNEADLTTEFLKLKSKSHETRLFQGILAEKWGGNKGNYLCTVEYT